MCEQVLTCSDRVQRSVVPFSELYEHRALTKSNKKKEMDGSKYAEFHSVKVYGNVVCKCNNLHKIHTIKLANEI